MLADSPRWLYAEPGQLRLPWRLVAFGVTLFLAQGIVESLVSPLFELLSGLAGEPLPAYPWTMLIAVTATVAFVLRSVDDAEWSAVALGDGAWSARALARGGMLGAVAIGLTVLLLLAVGALRVEPMAMLDGNDALGAAWSGTALRLLFLLAPAALWEELIFRGYLWHAFAESTGKRAALWATSGAFTAVHLLNPGAGVRTTLLVLLAGLCLGLMRMRTSSLPAAWSAHLAWNWIMAAVLHVPVSGLVFATPGYRTVLVGPDWLTGGLWGPEGGVMAACALLVMLAWTQRASLQAFLSTRTGRTRRGGQAAATTRS